MNEMTIVATNGSWVIRMVKISAGSSGALRAQSPERWSALLGAGGLVVPAPVLVAVVDDITAPLLW